MNEWMEGWMDLYSALLCTPKALYNYIRGLYSTTPYWGVNRCDIKLYFCELVQFMCKNSRHFERYGFSHNVFFY